MGWNTGYSIMEETVVGAYNLGVLDVKLLKVLMEPYRDSDIDSGGSADLTAKDGKDVKEIVCGILGIKLPAKPKLPKGGYDKWNESEREADEKYREALYEAFNKATKRYGW